MTYFARIISFIANMHDVLMNGESPTPTNFTNAPNQKQSKRRDIQKAHITTAKDLSKPASKKMHINLYKTSTEKTGLGTCQGNIHFCPRPFSSAESAPGLLEGRVPRLRERQSGGSGGAVAGSHQRRGAVQKGLLGADDFFCFVFELLTLLNVLNWHFIWQMEV